MRLKLIFYDFIKIFYKLKNSEINNNYILRTKIFSKSKRQKIEHDFINKILKKFHVKRVLDFGCNDGVLKISLSKRVDYNGIDINKKLKSNFLYSKKIKIYKKRIPTYKVKFDCIIISHVIGHIYNPIKVICDLKKNLKKKGIIIIITPNKYFKLFIFFSNLFNNYIPDTTVIKYYSKNEILEILKIKNLNPIYFKSYSIIQGTLRKKLISERLFFVAQA